MRKPPHPSRAPGFALIISLSLMGFILLLMLSLSSLTMVDLSTTSQNQIIQQARQNAQLGLFEAIGQLQKLAGPDQRVTASGAILDESPQTSVIDGIGNARYWTGVWDAEYPTDNNGDPVSVRDSSTNPQLIQYNDQSNRREDSTAANSRFLGWLVSGNISYTDAIDYSPDEDNDALLVGSGSVAQPFNGDGSPKEAVYAPKESVHNADGAINGRYAYWIDDEGLKARFNLRDSHKDAMDNSDRRYSFLIAQRTGVENTDALASAAFPINDLALDKMISLPNLSSYLDSDTAAKASFHDLTATSCGLLTDAKHGGLKKDLTSFFERPENEAVSQSLRDLSFYNTTAYFDRSEPRVADFPQPKNVFSDPGPTWKKLRSFYKLKDDYTAGAVAPRTHKNTQYGIGPLAIRGILSFFPEIRESGNDLYIRVHLSFKAVLWNPYNVPLAAHSYEIEFMNSGSTMVLFPQFVFDDKQTDNTSDAPDNIDGRWYYPNSFVARHGNMSSQGGLTENTDGVFQHPDLTSFLDEFGRLNTGVVFRTPPISLDPGEVVLLSIDNANDDEYEEGYQLAVGDFDGSVFLEYPNPLPSQVSNGITMTDDEGDSIQIYPKFHWRPWRSWGAADPALGSEYSPPSSDDNLDIDTKKPWGDIRGFALREPLGTSESRTLKNGTGSNVPVVGLDAYYSRMFRENHSRVELASMTANTFASRTSTPIATYVKPDVTTGKKGGRAINGDWNGPNFKAKIEYQTFMYPFDDGPEIGNSIATRPAALVHRNPMAIESRRDGFEYQGTPAGGNNYSTYTVIGWNSGPKYPSYGTSTVIGSNTDGNAYFGQSYNQSGSNSGRTHLPLIDAPSDDEPVLSLGFFQHANLYRQDTAPAFQIGNSFPEIRLRSLTETVRDSTYNDNDTAYNVANGYAAGAHSIIDSTYLLNDALWDRFFLSTYEDPEDITDPDFTPPNARLVNIVDEESIPNSAITDFFNMAAAYLVVNGAFNVNSTSVEAWKAVLGSLSDLDVDPKTGGTISGTHDRVVSHFSSPDGDADDTNKADLWTGYRKLTDAQLTALASAMVEQVKIRGPFLSMSEFVNRRLANNRTGYRGAMQEAIDSLDYTDSNNLSSATSAINANVGSTFGANRITDDGSSGLPPELFIEEAARAHQFTGVSGWVTQGDILQAIGPSLTVRSDTFRIRAYGEVVDPLTGNILGRAWCEAIVQRVPTPMTPGGANADSPGYYEPGDAFGRKFEIVSFNWLTPNEI